MNNFPINPNPDFQETMRPLQPDDPAHADMFNQMFQTLLDNDAFLNVLAERMIEKNAIANNLTTNDTNMVLSAAMGKTLAEQVKDTITSDTKDNITTFLQSGTRSNITSGENHSFMLGKISKWFADLKRMAFKDKVDAGDLEASLKSYIDSKFAAENIVQNAEIADAAKVASSAVTHDLQQQITEQNNNLLLQSIDIPLSGNCTVTLGIAKIYKIGRICFFSFCFDAINTEIDEIVVSSSLPEGYRPITDISGLSTQNVGSVQNSHVFHMYTEGIISIFRVANAQTNFWINLCYISAI